MATWVAKWYGKSFLSAFNKEIDYLADTIVVAASTVTEVPDQDVDDYEDDITNEVVGGGYARKTLASKTLTYTGATNKIAFDAADLQWTTATFTMRNLHFIDTTPGTTATNPLLWYQTADGDVVGGGGNLDFAFDAAGIAEITVS